MPETIGFYYPFDFGSWRLQDGMLCPKHGRQATGRWSRS